MKMMTHCERKQLLRCLQIPIRECGGGLSTKFTFCSDLLGFELQSIPMLKSATCNRILVESFPYRLSRV
jgi:hypothetical protein